MIELILYDHCIFNAFLKRKLHPKKHFFETSLTYLSKIKDIFVGFKIVIKISLKPAIHERTLISVLRQPRIIFNFIKIFCYEKFILFIFIIFELSALPFV